MDNCVQTTNYCLSCGIGDMYWKGRNNAKFPQTDASYNRFQTKVMGGINNSKNFRTSASSFTMLKKSLTTFNPISTYPAKSTLGKNTTSDGTSYKNAGGPGDEIVSVPIVTRAVTGNKARTISQVRHTGVDVKHGSYERYLARKRGINMRCQNC
jgi:hypothetical protein|tara:strand:+ start:5421 stop:5882 length:462 start_codon:yes stop_codon:yes gene_type:complete